LLKALRSCWSFFIYSNLFMAGCAALMTAQSGILFTPGGYNGQLILFVFFATLCSYSFHWYFTGNSLIKSERLHWLETNRWVHVLFFFTGLAGTLYYFQFFTQYWHWIAGSMIATFLYSAPKIPFRPLQELRKLALGKTIFLAAVWTYVSTVLPFVMEEAPWTRPMTLFTISRYFYVYMICILFDYRDRTDDKNAGIRSLITYMEPAGIRRLFLFSFGISLIATVGLYIDGLSVADTAFIVLGGLIVLALYRRATRDFSDWLFYFVLDGLMAFSALLSLFARI
jgi:1,4-dihydroxy-2-naphthoate octaprenyltransferase